MTALDTPSKSPAAASGDSGSGGGVAGGGARPAGPGRSRSRKTKVRLLVAGAVLLGVFAFLLVEGLANSLNYFETVNQAIAQRERSGRRRSASKGSWFRARSTPLRPE